MDEAEFHDPRLVEVYDVACPWSPADDFYLALVGTPSRRVLDLGCGTGRLTVALAGVGHTVTGVDPAAASLAAARVKPGAAAVRWIQGTSGDIPRESFDIAVMTSHVAQFFVDDDDWAAALGHLRRCLVPGGMLAFESRDPGAREWEGWNPDDSRERLRLPDGRVLEVWTEVTSSLREVIHFTMHFAFPDGAELLSHAALRFRSQEDLRATLRDAGFSIEQVYGGWNRQPVGAGDGEFVVVARAGG